MSPSVFMRHYLAHAHLRASRQATMHARELEAMDPATATSADIWNHRAYVMSAIVSAVAYLEAAVNEVFQDAADATKHPPFTLRGVDPDTVAALQALWTGTRNGRGLTVLGKYQMLLHSLGARLLDPGADVYQRVDVAIDIRNYLVHFHPESVTPVADHQFKKRLAGYRITENPLIVGEGHPWWPGKGLGSGLAEWCCEAAAALVSETRERTGINMAPILYASRS